MKKWIISLFAVAFIAGCSTTPDTLKPHAEKYTFQFVSIEIPEAQFKEGLSDTEALIHHPAAEVAEYPVVIAGLGECVTNDQTRSVMLAEDYNVVDGRAVAKEKECKLGYLVSITVHDLKNEVVSYHLKALYNELVGYDEYDLGEGLTAKMPFFERRSVDTDLKQKPNTWVTLGGLVDERSDGKRMSHMLGVRIIPPAVGE